MRRAAAAAALLLVLAGAGAWLLSVRPRPAGDPVATLVVLTGTAQVTSAGSGTAVVARSGERLGDGDRVATGPGTRARLLSDDGEETRLDSGTIVVIGGSARSGVTFRLLAGKTWNRKLGRQGVVDPADPWRILNQALDLLPSEKGPAAIGAGSLLPGEESTAQQAYTVGAPAATADLVFTAGWGPGTLELLVVDPAGKLRARRTASPPPFSLTIPRAEPGVWGYRLRDLDRAGGGTSWYVLVSVLTPSNN